MTRTALSLLALLALGLCLPAPALSQNPGLPDATAAGVKTRLSSAMAKRGQAACVLLDLDSGDTLLDFNGDAQLAPASNMKVLTSAAALCTLGKDFEFSTRVLSRGSLSDGTLKGDLCLVGGGDPNISGRFYNDEPLTLLRQWAEKLKTAGIKSISGDLLYDSTLFGGDAFCPGWPQDDQFNRWYCAEVSALAFNDNCIAVKVTPGKVGEAANVVLVPQTNYCTIVNETKTTAGKGAALIDLRRERGQNVIRVKGNVPANGSGGFVGEITVSDGAAYFATVFRETLEAAGIKVEGQTRAHTLSAEELGAFSTLVDHRAKLLDALKPVNTNSQNLHAEMLLRQLGLAYAGKGTFKTGAAALEDWLTKKKLWDKGMVIVDGSGLSASNRVTARALCGVLALMDKREEAEAWRASMAVSGESGTLKKKLNGKLKGKVIAKTGYISGVRALSGYMTCGKKRVAFSMLYNDCNDVTECEEDVLEAVYAALS